MKFYAAGRFQSYEKVRRVIDQLAALGWECTYDWTRTEEFDDEGHPKQADPHNLPKEHLQFYGRRDIEGVLEADALILVADDRLTGAWVEFGIALGSRRPIRIYVIAPERWTIFLEQQQVFILPTWERWEQFVEDIRIMRQLSRPQ